MKHTLLSISIILGLSLNLNLIAETIATHVVITNDETILMGRIVEQTKAQLIFQKTNDDIVIIQKSDIKQINELIDKGSTAAKSESDKSYGLFDNPEISEAKYLRIPLYANYKPYSKLGAIFMDYRFITDGYNVIYGTNTGIGIGLSFDFDYSPIVGVEFKFFGITQENEGIDTIGWFGDEDKIYEYDVKWSQRTFFLGPRLHYQWSLLNPYVEMGLVYTSIGQTGNVYEDGSQPSTESYSRGYASFGFGYGFGLQLVTPFGMTVFVEKGLIKAKTKLRNIGSDYLGGGFHFNL